VELHSDFIRRAIGGTIWDLGNEALYSLCKRYPGHRSDQEIVAKVWLIGRSYAAALERRRANHEPDSSGDSFYAHVIVPKIQQSDIDHWLEKLRNHTKPELESALDVHGKVMSLFKEISGQDKRSLTSKYLHFHLPDHFYIYDTRASRAVSHLNRIRQQKATKENWDSEYAAFCWRCERLSEKFAQQIGKTLSKRDLDKVLLAYAESNPTGLAPDRLVGYDTTVLWNR